MGLSRANRVQIDSPDRSGFEPLLAAPADIRYKSYVYERFFASDPLTRARIINAMYSEEEMMERVRAFLRDTESD